MVKSIRNELQGLEWSDRQELLLDLESWCNDESLRSEDDDGDDDDSELDDPDATRLV